jgi:hypothetical protein
MKVIDLLNKIANGEELAPKIQFHNMIWVLKSDLDYCEDYYSKDLDVYLFHNKWALTNNLNDEVIEVMINDKEDKKIEKLKQRTDTGLFGSMVNDEISVAEAINKQANYISDIVDKINEIIDYLEENK